VLVAAGEAGEDEDAPLRQMHRRLRKDPTFAGTISEIDCLFGLLPTRGLTYICRFTI
jgi:hypothetical protein